MDVFFTHFSSGASREMEEAMDKLQQQTQDVDDETSISSRRAETRCQMNCCSRKLRSPALFFDTARNPGQDVKALA